MSAPLRILLTGIFLILQIYSSAQEKAEYYIKSEIPDTLLTGSNAVCRLDETDVEIKSPAEVLIRKRVLCTILNENAQRHASLYIGYDKLTSINSAEGVLYNSAGKEIKHFKKGDMSDYSNEGEAFVSDERYKTSGFSYNSYPYSVDFDYQTEVADAYAIPAFNPRRTNRMSVQISRYILTTPVNYKIRLKAINTDIKPTITREKDKIIYLWEIRNLPVIPDESFSIAYNPEILLGSTEFQMEGYKGNVSTWEDYGKFYYSLYQGRDVLPEELKKQVHILTDNLKDPYKKIAVLYDYLQKNTHYVLIMFGIGGLQPYDANYVAKNKYGDCKALSNFMVALLKEAGIKGYPVAIWGGEEDRDFVADFPSHQSNHIICAVPVDKDTVWLECTSHSLPAGFLGSFTADRYGLLINESGGFLVRTPAYLIKDNTSVRRLNAILDQDGNMLVKTQSSYRGLKYDDVAPLVHHLSKDDQFKYLKSLFNLPTYTVNSFNYTEDNSNRIPLINESLDISVSNYASVSGKRIFLVPDILNRSSIKFSDDNERKTDFEFKIESSDVDSVEILIPSGYATESRPSDIVLETKYGKYQMHCIIQGDKILYYRRLDIYRGRFPASSYVDIKNFYNSIHYTDQAQIVLVKKQN
jgi:hypothetical protein